MLVIGLGKVVLLEQKYIIEFVSAVGDKYSCFTQQDQMQSRIVQHLLLLESFYEKETKEIRLNHR